MAFKGPPNNRNRQLSKENYIFNTYEVYKSNKMLNALKPHDNICNTVASFRFLIKTRIV